MKKNWTRMFVVLLVLGALLALTGCSSKDTTAPAPTPAPAVAPAPAAAPEPAKVDTAQIGKDAIKAAAVNYFNTLPSDSNNIKAADVQKMIDSKTDFYGVDIRAAADYAKGHLPGFVNIPFAEVGKNIDKLPKDKLIIVQCYTGQTASQTVGVLRTAGYNAKNLHGGFTNGVTPANLKLVTQ